MNQQGAPYKILTLPPGPRQQIIPPHYIGNLAMHALLFYGLKLLLSYRPGRPSRFYT